jgi:hypothetical protein
LETELNLDPDSNKELIMDPDPNLQIILDLSGSGCTTLVEETGVSQQRQNEQQCLMSAGVGGLAGALHENPQHLSLLARWGSMPQGEDCDKVVSAEDSHHPDQVAGQQP